LKCKIYVLNVNLCLYFLALEFGSAAAPALAALLKMGSWLPTEEFSSKVLLVQYIYGALIFRCAYLSTILVFYFFFEVCGAL
jgi:hypothetical protein